MGTHEELEEIRAKLNAIESRQIEIQARIETLNAERRRRRASDDTTFEVSGRALTASEAFTFVLDGFDKYYRYPAKFTLRDEMAPFPLTENESRWLGEQLDSCCVCDRIRSGDKKVIDPSGLVPTSRLISFVDSFSSKVDAISELLSTTGAPIQAAWEETLERLFREGAEVDLEEQRGLEVLSITEFGDVIANLGYPNSTVIWLSQIVESIIFRSAATYLAAIEYAKEDFQAVRVVPKVQALLSRIEDWSPSLVPMLLDYPKFRPLEVGLVEIPKVVEWRHLDERLFAYERNRDADILAERQSLYDEADALIIAQVDVSEALADPANWPQNVDLPPYPPQLITQPYLDLIGYARHLKNRRGK